MGRQWRARENGERRGGNLGKRKEMIQTFYLGSQMDPIEVVGKKVKLYRGKEINDLGEKVDSLVEFQR